MAKKKKNKIKPIASYMNHGKGGYSRAIRGILLRSKAESGALMFAIEKFGNKCIYCGKTGINMHPDHLLSESKGGVIAKGNIVPACPECNHSKNERPWKLFCQEKKLAQTKINEIDAFRNRHYRYRAITLQEQITEEQEELRKKTWMLIEAVSEGFLGKEGHPKSKDVLFNSPEELYDELLEVIEKYKVPPQKTEIASLTGEGKPAKGKPGRIPGRKPNKAVSAPAKASKAKRGPKAKAEPGEALKTKRRGRIVVQSLADYQGDPNARAVSRHQCPYGEGAGGACRESDS